MSVLDDRLTAFAVAVKAKIANKANSLWTRASTGAIARPLTAKLDESVSVLDFGAVGNGAANDTVAIQAALNSRAGTILLPPGSYRVTSTLDFAFAGQRLVGGGVSSTSIVFATGTAPGLRNNGKNTCGFDRIKLKGSGNTAGEILLVQNCAGFSARGVRVETGFNGMTFLSTNNVLFDGFVVADHTGDYAVRFAGTSGTRADVLKLHGGEISHFSNPSITSILWESYAHSMTLLDVRVVRGGKGLHIRDSSGTGTSLALPSFLKASILEFDFPGAEAMRFDNVRDVDVANLYAHGATGNAVHLGADAWSIRLANGRITSASQSGVYTAGRFVQLSNVRCYDNSQAAANTYDGIFVDATASEMTVVGCASGWSDSFVTRQRYGLNIAVGASNIRYSPNNDFAGNQSGEVNGGADLAYRAGSDTRHSFRNANGTHFEAGGSTPNVVNNMRAAGGAAASPPQLLAEGSDTNIDLKLVPKGAGLVQFSYNKVTNADAPITGYITIKDNSGSTIKLAIIA